MTTSPGHVDPPSSSAASTTGSATPGSTPPAQGKDPLRASRTSGIWIAVGVFLVVIVLLAVFVLQNTQKVHISFLGWDGSAPLAAMLMLATAAGMILAVSAGTLRILQLRRRVRRDTA